MRQLLARTAAVGLEQGFRETMALVRNPDYFVDYALRDGRAGWMFLLPLKPRARILDIGCGPGSLSISLARQGYEVFGMDLTLERVQFLMLRARLLGLESICGIHGGDGGNLPFASDAFDMVILNGVLEWLADGTEGSDPYEIQLRFLAEAARVLGPDGNIYVGIENRYGKDYFFGKIEEHARIPWVSLLPRWGADMYARARKGRDYRTWTHSLPALSSLLRKAGFQRHTLLLPIPDYREYFRVVDGESRTSIDEYLRESPKKRIFRAFGGITIIRYLAPSFGMVGGKSTKSHSSWLSRLAQHVPALNGGIVEKYLVTATDTIVARFRTPRTRLIVRVPLNEAAYEACLHNNRTIQRLSESPEPWLPQIITSGDFEQSHYFIETAIQGEPITATNIPAAMRFLIHLHSRPVSPCNWQQFMNGIRSVLQPFFPTSSPLSELTSFIEERLRRPDLPAVITHGDYWRGNILANRGKIVGLVDWSHAVFGVPSMSDALHLLIFEQSEKSRATIVNCLLPFIHGRMSSGEKRLLDGYVAAMKLNLDAATRAAFAAQYWLEYLAQRLGRPGNRYAPNPRWLSSHVSDAAITLAGALGLGVP